MSSPRAKWTAVVGVALLVVAALSVIALRKPQDGGPPPNGSGTEPAGTKTPVLSAEERVDLARQAARAIAWLENDQLGEAETAFAALAARLPGEPIAIRNWAITRLQNLLRGKGTLEQFQELFPQLLVIEPNVATTHWLAARAHGHLAAKIADPGQQVEATREVVRHLRRAIELDPNNPLYPFEIHAATRYLDSAELRAEGQTSLAATARLAPRNLFVISELASVLVAAKSPDALTTLDQFESLIQPLVPAIKRRTRYDVGEFLAVVRKGIQEGSPAAARISSVLSLVRSEEVSRSDGRRFDGVSPLEATVHAFSDKFLAANPSPEFRAEAERPLQMPAAAIPLPTTDVRDLRCIDVDLDGRLELALLHDAALEVYRWPVEAAAKPLMQLELPPGSRRMCWGDLDRDSIPPRGAATPPPPAADEESCFDADPDLIVIGDGGVKVFRNEAPADLPRQWVEAPQPFGLSEEKGWTAALLVDFDHDGDLDLLGAAGAEVRVWSSLEDLTFERLPQPTPLAAATGSVADLALVDWDRDVDLDLLAAVTGGAAGQLENLRHGEGRWVTLDESLAPLADAASLALLEANGKWGWEVAAAGPRGLTVLATTISEGNVVRVTHAEQVATDPARRVAAADLDNDGFVDLLVQTNSELRCHRGLGDGHFAAGQVLQAVAAAARFDLDDLDGDGDLDLAIAEAAGAKLLRNDTAADHHWLRLRVLGKNDEQVTGRVNQASIGSVVEIKHGPQYQAQIITRPETHFGLGSAPAADLVRIVLTNGIPQDALDVAANRTICEEMALKGSCPYVYTWNGGQFEFFTDLLWAAPIGLQLADGVLAPSRPWEYLKIDGDRLQPRDGHYELRVTEELWEAAYFDQIELLAVDHPGDVEVFSNEKVGPPEIAQFKLHTVRQRLAPRAARDQRGRDVLPQVAHHDQRFTKLFDVRWRQGLVEDHYLELEWGDLADAQSITLFLTGWIRPTDTSLNVAIAQNPHLAAPRLPAIWVPDRDGRWREVIPYMGFPGGKTKTIAVDLSGAFLAEDYRVRIATSAEIYWDEAFLTIDEAPAATVVQPLALSAAELRYRGFSRTLAAVPHGPDRYDYDDVSTAPKWPAMDGRLTRYGDVRPLLIAADHQLVVMGSGDEIALRFRPPANPPPAGWRRDFILHNVGWDKDADLHTVYGQAVEPLPSIDMTSYPYDTPPPGLLTREYQVYLHRYQQRSVPTTLFNRRVEQH